MIRKPERSWVWPAVDTISYAKTDVALKHSLRLCELINTENIGIMITQNDERPVFLPPYWWYGICMGSNAQTAIEELFEGSRQCQGVDILHYLVIAHGYIRLTTPESAKAIWDNLWPALEQHPHKAHWGWLLAELHAYWNEEHPPKLVTAALAGGCKVYLYFTDGSIRLADLQPYVDSNRAPDLYSDEEFFRIYLTQGNESLVWTDYDDSSDRVISSELLWEISQPVQGLAPEKIFPSSKPDVISRRVQSQEA